MAIKLVCFDLDGTLVENTEAIWKTLHEELGTDSEARRKAVDQFLGGEISYDEWARHDAKLWMDAGVKKEDMLKVLSFMGLSKNAIETVKELKKRNMKTAIVSGSLDIALENIIPDYKTLFDFIYINRIHFDNKGNITGITPTRYDFENKADALKEMMEELGLKKEETMFVGDHNNDVQIAQLAGISVAFNSKAEELDKVATHILDGTDMYDIIRFL